MTEITPEEDNRAADPVVARQVQSESMPDNKTDINVQTFDKVRGAEEYSQRQQDAKLKRYVEQQRRRRAYERAKQTSHSMMKRRLQRTETYKEVDNVVADKDSGKSVLGPVMIIGAAIGMAAFVMASK